MGRDELPDMYTQASADISGKSHLPMLYLLHNTNFRGINTNILLPQVLVTVIL